MPKTTLPLISVDGDTVRARRSDPETSHAAADSSNREGSRVVVLAVLREHGPLADHEMVAFAESHGSRFTAARLRTARHELVGEGAVSIVVDVERLTPSNRRAKVWAVAS